MSDLAPGYQSITLCIPSQAPEGVPLLGALRCRRGLHRHYHCRGKNSTVTLVLPLSPSRSHTALPAPCCSQGFWQKRGVEGQGIYPLSLWRTAPASSQCLNMGLWPCSLACLRQTPRGIFGVPPGMLQPCFVSLLCSHFRCPRPKAAPPCGQWLL